MPFIQLLIFSTLQRITSPITNKTNLELFVHELRDEWVILEDGTVAVGYATAGYAEETLTAEAYTALVQHLASAWRHFPQGTLVQQLDIYYPTAGATLSHQRLLYLCYTPHKAPYEPQNTFFALGNAGLRQPFQDLERSLKTLQHLAKTFEASLPTAWRAQKLRDHQHLQCLHAYFNLEFQNPPAHFERTIATHKGMLQVGEHYVGILSMQSQAEAPRLVAPNHRGVTAPFSAPLFQALRIPHITVQALRWLDTEAFLEQRREAMEWQQGAAKRRRHQEKALHTIEQVAAFENALRQRAEILVSSNVLVIAFEKSAEALAAALEKSRKAFYQIGAVPLVETYDTANLFFAAMPAGAVQLYRGLPMPLETALAYINTTTTRKGSPCGIQLFDRDRQPILYNPFNLSLDNQHAFVFGPSGAGKSFLNGKMIKERYEQGHMVIVLDSGKTYQRLFEALGGKYIDYHPNQPLGLNPFLINPTKGKYVPSERKLLFLLELVGKMWKGNLHKRPMKEVEKTLLTDWLMAYYQSLEEQEVPMLSGFYNWLQRSVEKRTINTHLFAFESFFLILKPFATGLYSQHFNAQHQDVLATERLICFELEAVKSHPKLYPLVVQILIELALELVAMHPAAQKFIDVEEGWSMLDQGLEATIEGFFRKGRKHKTSIRLITQDIEEVATSPIAGAMKNNASTCILLYNEKASSREAIGQFLGLSSHQMEQYASLRRGRDFREVLIKEMDKSNVWMLAPTPYEHALLTSQPDERQRIEQLQAQKGSLQKALKAWVQEQA